MSTTTLASVTSQTRAATLILEHAERADLPTPFTVRTTEFDDRIHLQFTSLAALTEWAKWLDSPIGETRAGNELIHEVLADALDQPVRCIYLATPTGTGR